VLAVVAAAPGARAATGSVTAGYVATGGRYTSVSVGWTQPAAVCDGTATATEVSVGLDGYGSGTAELTGTDADCTAGGVASYTGWYELYPAAPIAYTQPIHAHDAMNASVTTDGLGNFTLTLTDATAGWTRQITRALSGAALASAEVLARVPTSTASSTTTHNITFTGALVNGSSLDKFTPTQLTGPGVHVSPLTGGSFTITW